MRSSLVSRVTIRELTSVTNLVFALNGPEYTTPIDRWNPSTLRFMSATQNTEVDENTRIQPHGYFRQSTIASLIELACFEACVPC